MKRCADPLNPPQLVLYSKQIHASLACQPVRTMDTTPRIVEMQMGGLEHLLCTHLALGLCTEYFLLKSGVMHF